MELQEYTLLLVEDDRDLPQWIGMAIGNKPYRLIHAGNGLEAKKKLEAGMRPDLIILDVNMPGMDGFSFCRWLREDFPMIPVIFLSARSEEYDKILALEIGGDDYLTKPFSMKELMARIAVSLRRVQLYAENIDRSLYPLECNDLSMNRDTWSCSYRGEEVILTLSEFRILYMLAEKPGQVLNRDQLTQGAFPDDLYNNGRSIDIHISRIRKKLQKIDRDFHSIETVYQVGYKWVP